MKDKMRNWFSFFIPLMITVMVTMVTTFTLMNFGFFNVYAQGAQLLAVDPSDYTFFGQVLNLVKTWGGLEASVKISAIITLIISSMKVSFLKKFWDALVIKINGQVYSLQILVVPVLSIVIGLSTQGKLSIEAVFAYLVMGGGAVYFHEIMDFIKTLPIVNPIIKVIVDIVSYVLGGQKPKA